MRLGTLENKVIIPKGRGRNKERGRNNLNKDALKPGCIFVQPKLSDCFRRERL